MNVVNQVILLVSAACELVLEDLVVEDAGALALVTAGALARTTAGVLTLDTAGAQALVTAGPLALSTAGALAMGTGKMIVLSSVLSFVFIHFTLMLQYLVAFVDTFSYSVCLLCQPCKFSFR